MITKYTSFDEVRSVLGVEDDELDDSTLGLSVYYNHLLEMIITCNFNGKGGGLNGCCQSGRPFCAGR